LNFRENFGVWRERSCKGFIGIKQILKMPIHGGHELQIVGHDIKSGL
jgi:hypothetical protein